ncbi:uncharacterized protein LOC132262603 [Phlebotomus argentipes]|uniref:uncharacterized protein LOC132262603 n=1 Tax=Phlebotomus argentipes TaxID=94469 RepID=UPI00289307BC|nr:uncharacterized protein LOC132262603 [Phlebotomus argentipes]
MNETPQTRKRSLLKRSVSVLTKTRPFSPRESPERKSPSRQDEGQFKQQNFSTPISSRHIQSAPACSPENDNSPIVHLSQDLHWKADVAWGWDSPKNSPAQRKFSAKKKSSPITRSHSLTRPNARRDQAKTGFFRFRKDLMTMESKYSSTDSGTTTSSGSPTVEAEKSATSRVETTADMLKYVLEDSNTSDKTVVQNADTPGPSKAMTTIQKDFLFDDSADDRDLAALIDDPPVVVAQSPEIFSPAVSRKKDSSSRTSSEEIYYTVEECVQNLDREIREDRKKTPAKPTSSGVKNPPLKSSSRDDELKWLVDDSFDDILSQLPLDGSSARNGSFARHASMPVQKQDSQLSQSSAKVINRYDSMPVNSTLRKSDEPPSRSGSSESISSVSSSGKCTMTEIARKRQEALQRLRNSKQKQLQKNLSNK